MWIQIFYVQFSMKDKWNRFLSMTTLVQDEHEIKVSIIIELSRKKTQITEMSWDWSCESVLSSPVPL